jgi:type IV pilus assembly protein PilN
MIRINLLPHREQKRAARQRQIAFLAVATAVLGAVIVLLVHTVMEARLAAQEERNQYLETEIKKLDEQIAEIKKLKEQTQALLARKAVVETLQSNRAEVVHLLDQLVRQLPEGIYLKAIKQTGNKVELQGYAQSNARVSTLMRNLDASPWLEAPELVEIKAATVNGLRASEFSLNITLTSPEKPNADEAAPSKSKDKKA